MISCGDMTGGIPEGHGLGRAGGGGGGGSEPAGNKDDRGGLPGWREGPSSEPPRRGSRPAAPTASPPLPPVALQGGGACPHLGTPPRTRGPTVLAGPRAHSPGLLGSFPPPGPLAPPESPSQLPGLAVPSTPQARAPRAPGPPHSGCFSVTRAGPDTPSCSAPACPSPSPHVPALSHPLRVPPAPGPQRGPEAREG